MRFHSFNGMNSYLILHRIVLAVALGFILVLNAQAQFIQEQQLSNLGSVVSISGDRLVVGDSGDDDNGSNAGAAYVFERLANGIWQEIVKLSASDASAEDRFGSTVELNGDRMVIGASGNDDDGENSGAAYVFERLANGDWQEVAKLTAFDAAAGDTFGSVACRSALTESSLGLVGMTIMVLFRAPPMSLSARAMAAGAVAPS